ncbi:Nif3-like dinuclear metal center hexameric protein [Magnetococcales bacterium HHB-1]
MVTLDKVEFFLNQQLECARYSDYCPNGVQVRGERPIRRVAGGVSACMALFEEALTWQADLILVHHGFFWKGDSKVIEGNLKKRLAFLLKHEITLMAYHLPLDAHPKWGNNKQIFKKLGLINEKPFGVYQGKTIGFQGSYAGGRDFNAVKSDMQNLFGGQMLALPFGPERVERVAICSGAAPELIREAKACGADLYLTGEATEHVYHFAREEGIHFIAAGHHRTETWGVRALLDVLKNEFALKTRFINIENPI